ncbi:NAD(P)/FAD-dependent oxidoreductase [Dyadobacter tibetensis]|uniref:NAD(P)/FAD-dependent oxidoreductase n=1 Tax=Dyadobacter tibetensis TaxID=1211851 RepID=UPI000472FB8E|nr:NAD(P)/FAD-dependent oxidoreductase [Dyadobacter tibetensis]
METEHTIYDCAVIGGGLAGLCTAIQLARRGKEVILFEKNMYPFHKVCGEYVSMESWDFLISLGVPLNDWSLPRIQSLRISSPSGFTLDHRLRLGGFGLSRFKLDAYLYQLAIENGVKVIQQCKVNDVTDTGANFLVKSSQGVVAARVVCGAYGKYIPSFVQTWDDHSEKIIDQDNYIAVKYHLRTDVPADRIELHNFKGGYCGVSQVEDGIFCLCYLTKAKNLKANQNNIAQMEATILDENPYLSKLFSNSDFLYEQPLVVSNIKFHKRQAAVGALFQAGDAAGTISPLCGNGMSMAMRSSKILVAHLLSSLDGPHSLRQSKEAYQAEWNRIFGSRIQTGIWLQRLFGKPLLTEIAVRSLSLMPSLVSKLVRKTHGLPF